MEDERALWVIREAKRGKRRDDDQQRSKLNEEEIKAVLKQNMKFSAYKITYSVHPAETVADNETRHSSMRWNFL